MAGVDHATGAARRRRERRLRAYLRYARISVAVALAEATHHTTPRGQRTARARGEGRDEMNCAMGQKTPLTRGGKHTVLYDAASTVCFTMDDGGDVLAARLTLFAEVWPQEWVQLHTAVHIVDILPYGLRWRMCCRRSTRRLSSRLSTCPRSLWTQSHSVFGSVVLRRMLNSWWKCPRSCPSLLYSSRLPSRSLTFLFQVVEVVVDVEVFKVLVQDRIQQRTWSSFLSG